MINQKPSHTSINIMHALKLLAYLLVIAAAVMYLLAAIVVTSSWTAKKASQLLSEKLRQPATIAAVQLRGTALEMRGIEIIPSQQKNPLLSVRSITIEPVWADILRGRMVIRNITIDSPCIAIVRSPDGIWNFSGVVNSLNSRKGSGTPTTIRALTINKGTIRVNDYEATNISLSLRDLSTVGSTRSRLQITGRDPSGGAFTFTGTGKTGGRPDMTIQLSAPALSLGAYKGKLPLLDMTQGVCGIELKADLHKGLLSTRGTILLDHLAVFLKGSRIPVKAAIDVDCSYRQDTDAVSLNRLSVTLNDSAKIRAAGEVKEVRKRGLFTGTITTEAVDIETFARFVPRELFRGFHLSGTFAPATCRFSGSRSEGLTTGNAVFSLIHGGLSREADPVMQNLVMHASLVLLHKEWHLLGKLTAPRAGNLLPAQDIDVNFTALFSRRFHLANATIPRMRLALWGLPLNGTVRYAPGDALPLSAQLELPATPLASLGGLPVSHQPRFTAGTASAHMTLSGSSPASFRAVTQAAVRRVHGETGGKPLSCRELTIHGNAVIQPGAVTLSSDAAINNALIYGRSINGTVAASLQNGEFAVTDSRIKIDSKLLTLAELRGPLPRWTTSATDKSMPLRLIFRNLSVTDGSAALQGTSGEAAGTLVRRNNTTWLEGTVSTRDSLIAYRGISGGPFTTMVNFSRDGAAAVLTGRLLGGTLTGSIRHDLSPVGRGTAFTVSGHALSAEGLKPLTGDTLPVRFTGGMLDTTVSGTYERETGISCRIGANGEGFTLSGKNNRTLLSDCGLKFSGQLNNGAISLSDCRLTVGKHVTTSCRGSLARASTPERSGEFQLELPSTPVTALQDATVGMLPRMLQEAAVSGSAGLRATVRIDGSRAVLDGSLNMSDATMDIPSQALTLNGIRGTIPFSLNFSDTAADPLDTGMVGRNSFAAAVEKLRQHRAGDSLLRIAKVNFGAMELGPAELHLRAANGLMEIASMHAEGYSGALLGSGYFRYGNAPRYGGNILVNKVSLRSFCDTYPAVKGYLSGKMSGTINLSSSGSGIARLEGYANLWAHAAKDEKMLISKEFLQRLADRKFKGIFFRTDRAFDRGEIAAYVQDGYLTFETLDISHTNFLGVRDLSVTVVPIQNRIALDHLFNSIKQAAERGKNATGGTGPPQQEKLQDTEFKWSE